VAHLRSIRLLALIAAVVVAAGVVLVLTLPVSGVARRPRSASASASALIRAAEAVVDSLPAPHVTPQLVAIEARGNARIRQLARLGRPIFCAGHRGHALALTFDDGPGVYTYLALRKLAAAHERATFFVVGKSINAFPRYLGKELAVGALADHTYTHPDLAVLGRAQVRSELASDRRLIAHRSGQRVDLFRPPYGATDPTVLVTARRMGLLTILWTQDSGDSLGANYAAITRNVERAMRPGAIILMHENRGQTIRALTALLPALHRRHLYSVSLPELFATDPPSVAQVKRGHAACGRVRISAGSN
jgi:peptidoglycan/xylan/chitin deacetylase (PgdA/CDA1 family)